MTLTSFSVLVPIRQNKGSSCTLAVLWFPCVRMSLEKWLRVLVPLRRGKAGGGSWVQFAGACQPYCGEIHITVKSTGAPQIHFADLALVVLALQHLVLWTTPWRWEHRNEGLLVLWLFWQSWYRHNIKVHHNQSLASVFQNQRMYCVMSPPLSKQ